MPVKRTQTQSIIDSRATADQAIRWDRLKVVCLLVLAFTALMAIAYLTRDILIPFVIAVFLNYAIAPVVKRLQTSLHIPRFISMALTLLMALALAAAIIFLVVFSLSGAFESFELYHNRIVGLIRVTLELLNGWLLPLQISIDSASVAANLKKLPVLTWARSVSSEIFGFLGQTVLTVLFFIFLVAGTRLKRRPGAQSGTMVHAVNDKIARYLGVKFTTSMITGILVGAILAILRVDLALLFGLLTFLLNFIPSIGSIIATLLPVPVALLQFGPGGHLLLVVALPGCVQFIIGSLVEPRIMGESLGLHPVVVLLSLLLWGFLWGIAGMLLAVPITAVLKILLEKNELTEPLARALEGRV